MKDSLPKYVPFRLYHGTSTLWEHSIRTLGLGGRRIIEELRALDFHRRARSYLKTAPADWPVGAEYVMERTDSQSVTKAGFNFRHGGVYLTPSRTTATNYAVHNPFGSELLTHCHLLYEAILNSKETPTPDWFEQYSDLLSILRRPGRPLIICLNHVRTDDLTDESGQPTPANLRWLMGLLADSNAEAARERERVESLRKAIQGGDTEMISKLLVQPKTTTLTEDQIIETLGQQANFEANGVIPASDLAFEEIRMDQ